MRVAYFGYNPLSSCLDVFAEHQHEISVIYTGEPGPYTDRVISYANFHQIPLCFDKPNIKEMLALVDSGVELFFCAEYPRKIPLPKSLIYGINVHPTMLPEGRGQTPVPNLLLNFPQHAGVTLHKLTEEFDRGDILLQKAVMIEEQESYDSLTTKLYVEAPKILDELLANIDSYYHNASSQEEGSIWQALTKSDQCLEWCDSTMQILKQVRAFGSLGTYAKIQGKEYLLTQAQGSVYKHNILAGRIICIDEQKLSVASGDGIINILRENIRSL